MKLFQITYRSWKKWGKMDMQTIVCSIYFRCILVNYSGEKRLYFFDKFMG